MQEKLKKPEQLTFDLGDQLKETKPDVPKVWGRETDAENLRLRTARLDQRLAVGRVKFTDKFQRLLEGLDPRQKAGVLSELNASFANDREYAIVLESLDYGRLMNNLDYTLDGLKKARAEGPLKTEHMHRLLRLGVVFDSHTPAFTNDQLNHIQDFMEGGTGYGRGVRIFGDMQFPHGKKALLEALHEMGVEKVTLKGGVEKKPREAPIKQLYAVYANEVRHRRARARRAERRLDEI